ncbi:MAG TPA: M23 family metallopeptidase [Gaiellaceae bacterium]|nr:M23 family metallopeptidase [Gaiellaceae bacterium]
MRRLALVVLLFLLWAPGAYAWSWPVQGPVLLGFSFDPGQPYAGGQHRGIDIGAPTGTSVAAPASGTVTFAGSVPTSGRSVTIATPDGYSVTLTHLGSIGVAKGASVGEGAAVGTVGPSGTPELDVPYVYMGVRVTADAQGYLDPLSFLPALPPPVAVTTTAPPPPPAAPDPVSSPATSTTTDATEPAPEPTTTPAAAEAPPAATTTEAPADTAADASASPPDTTTTETPASDATTDATASPPEGATDGPAPAPEATSTPSSVVGDVAAAQATTTTDTPVSEAAPAPPAPVSDAAPAPQPSVQVLSPDPGLDPTASDEPASGAAAPEAAPAVADATVPDPAPAPAAADDAFVVHALSPVLSSTPSAAVVARVLPTAVPTVRPTLHSPPPAAPETPTRTMRREVARHARTHGPGRRGAAPAVRAPARGARAIRPTRRHALWPLLLVLALAGAAVPKAVRMISSSSKAPEGAHPVADAEDPRSSRMAVCERTAAPGPCRRPGRAVRHLRPLSPAQGQRRPHGERDGRARHARDGVGGPRGRVAP